METAARGIELKFGSSVGWIIADSIKPRHLMLRLASSTNVAVPWEAGAFGPVLPWAANYSLNVPEEGAGAFAGASFYGFIAYAPDATKTELAVLDGSGWNWKTAAPGMIPRSVRVMPGTGNVPARAFVVTDTSLVETSTPALVPPAFPMGAVKGPTFAADRTTYLGLSSNKLQRCVFTTGACTDVTTTGFAPSDTLAEVNFDPFDGARILVRATTPAPLVHFYISTDDGATFQPVPLPTHPSRVLTVPGKPGTFVVSTSPPSSSVEIQITRNFGATWTTMPFPPTKMADISGLAVDAAGTLFLVREGTLFSRTL